jgi:hypothetical protein
MAGILLEFSAVLCPFIAPLKARFRQLKKPCLYQKKIVEKVKIFLKKG